jgi:tRNA pseudouridine38-40 synthase
LSFKGTQYAGWQIQNNAITVQGLLDQALSTILRNNVSTTGCGRTDAGVHASCFYAHFDLEGSDGLGMDEKMLLKGLNAVLPNHIAVFSVREVNPDYHARFSATSRTYEYRITHHKDPFLIGLATYHQSQISLDVLNEACGVLLGQNDFTSFSRTHTQVKTNICRLDEAHWFERDGLTIFRITSDRFLRGMVRAIVGTCFKGPSIAEMKQVLDGRDRALAGAAAPPEGLFLVDVRYPDDYSLNTISK